MLNLNTAAKNNGLDLQRFFINVWGKYYLFLLLLIVLFVSGFIHHSFFTRQNFLTVLASNATTAMVALGMFFVIVTGGIDLSVGSVIAFSCTLLANFLQQGMPWPLAIIISLILMTIPGVVSGSLITYGRIPPFMVTLAMMTIVRGACYIYQVGAPRLIFNKSILFIGTGTLGWIPMPVLILAILFIPVALILGKTYYGRRLYAIGGNPLASFLCGINVRWHILSVYIISSFIAAVAGIVLGSRLMMGAAIFGQGYELDAIASVVIGGASLKGGTGNAFNTVLGAFIFGFIGNILNLCSVNSYAQMVIKGLIIVVAVLLSHRQSQTQN